MAWYLGIVEHLWAQLLTHLWQATLVAGLLLALAALLRGAPAHLRYGLYLLASLKFLLPSALLLAACERLDLAPGSWLPASLTSAFDFQRLVIAFEVWLSLCSTAMAGPAPGSHRALLLVLLTALWLGGSALVLGVWLRRQRRFAALLELAPTGGDLQAMVDAGRRRLGIGRPVRLVLSAAVPEPGVWGVWRPVVVLPASMPELLSRAELETVLLHELVHVRRWDNLAGNLHMMLCALLWFHPLVWWLDRRLLAERERACDDRVLQLAGSGELYARSLVKVLRFGVGLPLAGASAATGADLRRRLEHIRSGYRAASPAYRAVVPAALLLLLLASLVPVPRPATASSAAVVAASAEPAARDDDSCPRRKPPPTEPCAGRRGEQAAPPSTNI